MDPFIGIISEHFTIVLLAGSILFGMCLRAATRIATTACRERSRREVAAYIAEGSMSAEQGERLLRADIDRGPAVP